MFCSKILVAYDGSLPAKKALDKALDLAQLDDKVMINVVHIINMHNSVHTAMSDVPGIENIFYTEGELILADAQVSAGELRERCTFDLLTGTPAAAILKQAKQKNCDLIIMGSRGLGSIKEFLGSVSHAVVHESRVPVLIIKS